jgi:hypothetical protein
MEIPMRAFALIVSVVLGAVIVTSPAVAQQKTAKACQQEWRANKAANQAAGITEKAYVAQCRTGASPTTQAPAAPMAPAATAPTQAPARTTAPAAPPRPMAPTASTSTSGANEFTNEAQAKARCPAGTVVWANLSSKVYHFAGGHNYGHTKRGAYMCEQDAQSAGIRAAKNEKHP